MHKKSALLLILFVLGSIGGSIGDLSHVLTGTSGYPPNVYWWYLPFGLPFWVPFLFGSLTMLLGVLHIQALQESKPNLGSLRWRVWGSFACLGLYLLSGFLPWPAGHLNDAILALGAGVIWWIWDRSVFGLVGGLGAALMGTTFEIILVQNDIFFYQPHAANFFGVPTWLPWLYFVTPGTLGNLALKMHQKIS